MHAATASAKNVQKRGIFPCPVTEMSLLSPGLSSQLLFFKKKQTPNDINDMKLLFLPSTTSASRKFRTARFTAFFAAVIGLFFVSALVDAQAQDSTTNTNDYFPDVYFGTFGLGETLMGENSEGTLGTLSFGGDGGLPLDGGIQAQNQATTTLSMRVASFPTTFFSGGGIFNQGTDELGMYANVGGTSKQAVAWSNFGTSGLNGSGASLRSLQVGDVFKITVSATRAFGQIGFSLNAGGTQGSSYGNNRSGSRLYVSTDNYAAWSVKGLSGGSTASLSYVPLENTFKNYAFTIRITSETTADVFLTVDGTDYRAYNLTLSGTAGANISALSIFSSDDWDGSSHENVYWKPTSQIENTGIVELGYYQTSGTFDPGKITDGLAANSASSSSANSVFVGGDAGSAVLLNQENTYTGATTLNAGATARASHANAFGTTAGGVSVTSGGMLELSGSVSIGAEALTLRGEGVGAAGALRNASGNNSWAGAVTLASSDVRINSDTGATLTLSGNLDLANNTVYIGGAGSTTISGAIQNGSKTTGSGALWWDGAGTLRLDAAPTSLGGNISLRSGTVLLGANNALGNGAITVGNNSTLTLASAGTTARTLNNSLTMATSDTLIFGNSGNTGNIDISGGLSLNLAAGNHFVNVTNSATKVSLSGAVSGTSKNLIKIGSGVLSLAGNNTYTGLTAIDAGTLQITAGSQSASGIDIGTLTSAFTSQAAALNLTAANNFVLDRNVTVKAGGDRTLEFGQGSGLNTISGTITLDKDLAVSVANSSATGVLSSVISGAGGLTKTGSGTLTLSGSSANSYSGLTTVSAGTLNLNKSSGNAIAGNLTVSSGATLLLSASDQVFSSGGRTVTLSGGTITRASGVSEVFGSLNITAASFLDFGSGTAGNLQFGTYAPSSLITVQNFFQGNTLRFATQLTSEQLTTNFSFDNGFTTNWNGSTFTITAIPEPSTYVAAAGLLALFLWPARRRLLKDAKSILGLRAPGRDRIEAYRNA
jgi:autotransporter-associated beta strand protein